MISKIIQIGKNVDVIPFAESVDPTRKILEMQIELGSSGELKIGYSGAKEANEKKFYHISPTKSINRGKNQHFYLHDFTLSNNFIQENEEKEIIGIKNEKVERNYKNTRGFYRKLEIAPKFGEFLDSFYTFTLKKKSAFINQAFNQNKSFFESITKREFTNLLFVYSISKKVVDYFNLEVKNKKDYYNLGEIVNLEDLYKQLITSETLNKAKEGTRCSFCNSKKGVMAPVSATVYFSFAKNPNNVFYDLDLQNADKHLLICNECYSNYNSGKKFMEQNLKSQLLGVKYFSVFEFEEETKNIKDALNYLSEKKIQNIYTERDLRELREELEENQQLFLDLGVIGEENGLGISLFFYEYDNGYRVLKTIYDIYPNRIVELLRQNIKIENFSFNSFLNNFFRDQSNNSYDLLIKWKLNLLEKILLKIPVNYDSLLSRFISKASYKLRNKRNASGFTQYFLKFLEFINRLNIPIYSNNISTETFNEEGIIMDTKCINSLEGKTGVEKMINFITKNEFLNSTPEIKAAIPLGVIISRLSNYHINNYDKRMLGYARKRINDIESLKKYINEIEEKIIMHDMGNQKIVSNFFKNIQQVFSKDSFSEQDFILGLFTGYSLAWTFTKDKV